MTIIKRILKAGLQGFYRNRTVSLSSIFILILTLSVVMGLNTAHYVFTYTLNSIKDKVDIRVYMKSDATDEEINGVVNHIKSIANVKSVLTESKVDALSKYKESHKNDKGTLIALDEIGVNPFGASITVQAIDTSYYADIEKSIQKYSEDRVIQAGASAIDHINYQELRTSIEKINNIISQTEMIGIWISSIFIIMSFTIVYNTTRLSIYVFREEINIMKLVGASNFFVRGPFIVEAVLYAVVATVFTLILYYPLSLWLTSKSVNFLQGLSIYEFYVSDLPHSAGLLLITGVTITAVSSYIAVRRYLLV